MMDLNRRYPVRSGSLIYLGKMVMHRHMFLFAT